MITDWSRLAREGVARIGPAEGLPIVSLHRPWDEPVAIGQKPVENRTWPPAPWLIGQPIAFHAAKKYDATCIPFIAERGFTVGDRKTSNLQRAGRVVSVATVLGFYNEDVDGAWECEDFLDHPRLDLPQRKTRRARGVPSYHATAASAVLDSFDRVMKMKEEPYWMGPVGWLLGEAIELDIADRPLVTGRQGLFRLSPAQSRSVCRAAATVQERAA